MEETLVGPETMNAPWSLNSRMSLALAAVSFFGMDEYEENCATINRPGASRASRSPFVVRDFLDYLQAKGTFKKPPNLLRVIGLLNAMSKAELLMRVGRTDRGYGSTPLDDAYVYVGVQSEVRRRGGLVLAQALGSDALYWACVDGLVHITGVNEEGDAVAGTGFVVDKRHIVTCRHVVKGMRMDRKQRFKGREYEVQDDSVHSHERDDVAVLRILKGSLEPIAGLVLRPGTVGETVYALGYPKLPTLREAAVVMQQGTITTGGVTSLEGESLFLYSAISRPGNSGGPIMSEDGYLVGMTSRDLTGEYKDGVARGFAPHYAAVPSQVVVRAIRELGFELGVPFVNLE